MIFYVVLMVHGGPRSAKHIPRFNFPSSHPHLEDSFTLHDPGSGEADRELRPDMQNSSGHGGTNPDLPA